MRSQAGTEVASHRHTATTIGLGLGRCRLSQAKDGARLHIAEVVAGQAAPRRA